MMKKGSFLLVSILILGLIFAGCSVLNNSGVIPTSEPDSVSSLTKASEVDPDEYPLYANRDILVGEVLVWNDDDNLHVTYVVDDPWYITETHLAVATDKDDIPTNKKGSPVTGQFPYGDDNLEGAESSVDYCISFVDLGVECDDELVIAAFAVIEKAKDKKKVFNEDVWGAEGPGEIRFVEKGKGDWATYFTYTLECLKPTGITVCKDDPEADYTTIQAAIDAAGNGDTIIVCPGTYYENIEFDGKNITVQSSNPSSPSIVATTVIDGGKSGSVVRFVNGDTSTLEGFTVRNGNLVKFGYGGGIYVEQSSPTISGNSITGNTGIDDGGGIYMSYSSPNITDNTITGNTANDGGGIYMHSSSPNITDNTITGNTANDDGGGIFVFSSSPAIIDNTITGNMGTDDGGGIYVYDSSPIITGNIITYNEAQGGGGICVSPNSNLLPDDFRPTGWGTGRENIPTGATLDPVEGVLYTIADNEFLGNEHGSPLDYTEGAHVYFQ
jgi:parallel beta-helix repeat protein